MVSPGDQGRLYDLSNGGFIVDRILCTEDSPGCVIDVYEIDGGITGFAVGRSGDVIITTWGYMILPEGERIPIEGGVNNLVW